MSDLVLETIRAIIVSVIFLYLLTIGGKEEIRRQEGWLYILFGFGLILFGMFIDITDNFSSLNHYIIIGETKYQAFLEKVVGYLFGFILLAVGFWKWTPTIIRHRIAERELKKSHDELELRIDERTVELREEITERKQAGEKLRESEHKLRVSEQELKSIVNNTPDIIYRLDSNGNILFVNQSVKEYGYSIEELIGKNILELVHPDDKEKAIYRMNERRTGDRRTKSFEIRLLTKDLTAVPFESRSRGFGSFLIDAEGLYSTEKPSRDSFVGTQGVARDISERKRTEEALLESEEKHRLFFENALVGIIHYNSEGIITAINNAMIATFGSSREKLIGLNIDDIPDKKFAKEVCESLNGKLGYYEGEYTSYTGGKPVIIKANWIPIVRGGEVISGVGIVEDITDRKRAEEERERLIAELQVTLSEVKTLRGFLPICSSCKNIRDDKGYWNQIETYISNHSEAEFSHSMCPECAKKLYPDLQIYDDD